MTPLSACLICHPDSRSRAVQSIDVRVSLLDGNALLLVFDLDGDLARVQVPPPVPPRRAEGLWRHTCFEAFVAAEGSAAYREFNFSLSGEWAVYAFRSYRDGDVLQCESPPRIRVNARQGALQLEAAIPLELLPASGSLCLALSAVIEEERGFFTYWALAHAPGRPDFHHPAAFAMRLAALTK